jgi:hypothetical protein
LLYRLFASWRRYCTVEDGIRATGMEVVRFKRLAGEERGVGKGTWFPGN